MNNLLLGIIVAISFQCIFGADDTLLFVAEIADSGFHYPKEDLFDWVKGRYTHLSNSGMRQQYLLGREIRKYLIEDKKLIGDRYVNREQMLVRSWASPHAVASANAQLMGIYIPGSGDLLSNKEKEFAFPPNKYDYSSWIEELENAALNYTYQVVPIIEHGGVPDYLLNSEHACEGVKTMIKFWGSDYAEKQHAYAGLLNRLGDAFGMPSGAVKNVSYGSYLRHMVLLSIAEGRPVFNDIVKAKELYELTKDVEKAAVYDFMLDVKYDDRIVSKIIATPLLRELLQHFEMVKKDYEGKTKYPLKFMLYLGSPHLIQALVQQLNWGLEKELAPRSSMLFLELYKNATSSNKNDTDYYLKMTFNKYVKDGVSYSKFSETINENTYSDEVVRKYCVAYSKESESGPFDWMLLLIIAGVILGIGLLGFLVYCIKVKCSSSEDSVEDEEQVLRTLRGQLGVAE